MLNAKTVMRYVSECQKVAYSAVPIIIYVNCCEVHKSNTDKNKNFPSSDNICNDDATVGRKRT